MFQIPGLVQNLLFFALACIALVISSTILVRCLIKIAMFLRLSTYVVSFIIMGIATSLPELFVGITSAIQKNPALSFGNIIGANILDLTLVIGIITLLGRGIRVKSKETKKDALFMSMIAILPLVLFFIGKSLSRIDGIILVAVFLVYSIRMIKREKEMKMPLANHIKRFEIFFTTLLFVACVVVLYFSANFVVKYASLLSIQLALPSIMIGIFLISLGTTLPELTFGIRAVQLGHSEMVLGDQIGTVIFNSTFILGVVAIIFPITAEFAPFFVSAIFLALVAFLFITFVESGRKITINEGIAMILLYVFFVIIQLYLQGKIVV